MSAPAGHHIHPRNAQFDVEAQPRHWHSGDPAITHFYNGLSLTFPEGERFFVESVRRFQNEITDPRLREEVRGFTAQEGAHAREHDRYNAWLSSLGLKPEPLLDGQKFMLRKVLRRLPAKGQLAITCALEHFTALFAEALLADPRAMEGASPEMRDLWRWHALEEAEHRAVAFDVYKAVAPGLGGYLRRIAVMTVITFDFSLAALVGQSYLMARDGQAGNVKSWLRGLRYLWVTPGVWRRILAGVPDYYRPHFHPSQRGDALLNEWAGRYRPDGGPGHRFAG